MMRDVSPAGGLENGALFFLSEFRGDSWLKSSVNDEHADFGYIIVLATCGQTLKNTTVLFCFDLKIMVGELVCGYQRKFKSKTSEKAFRARCYSSSH